MATIHILNPVADRRWADLVDEHPQASIFHSPAWLTALQRTYGYQPMALTLTPPQEELTNGIAFARVASRLTGTRLVSLPFADHCQPLTQDARQTAELTTYAGKMQRGYKYIELRPHEACECALPGFGVSAQYLLHTLDLTPDLEQMFGRFHPSCLQRRIRHAERMNLAYEESRSESALADFYKLQVMTRARHNLPPQPTTWFENLRNSFGDRFTVHTVCADGKPIASMITLRHNSVLTYKYGASDASQHRLGGVALLFWRTIQSAKANGVTKMDLGRSDLHGTGLVEFKDHLGARRSQLCYLRSPEPTMNDTRSRDYLALAGKVFAHTPPSVAKIAGSLLYKHAG